MDFLCFLGTVAVGHPLPLMVSKGAHCTRYYSATFCGGFHFRCAHTLPIIPQPISDEFGRHGVTARCVSDAYIKGHKGSGNSNQPCYIFDCIWVQGDHGYTSTNKIFIKEPGCGARHDAEHAWHERCTQHLWQIRLQGL